MAEERYCAYDCKFCYVNGPFNRYAKRDVDEIFTWLSEHRGEYSIVYVSGDTDSFAPPRTAEALHLLRLLFRLDVDVLFTTRHVFSGADRSELTDIANDFDQARRLLIACVSVSQLHHPALEPLPIPSPRARLKQLADLKSRGITTALTIRPFIPAIPSEEYAEIARLGAAHADVVLGGDWYTDIDGFIETRTSEALGERAVGSSGTSVGELDFTASSVSWNSYTHPAAHRAVRDVCSSAKVPLFMRSAPAVEWLRGQRDAES
jgi:DNA repair photolyase